MIGKPRKTVWLWGAVFALGVTLWGCGEQESAEESAAPEAVEESADVVADAADGAGSCNYTMQNMFAGPYKVCKEPAAADACTALGTTDDNSDAVHSASSCSSEGSVGSCVAADGAVIYYEGDPSGLEIGCGFQAGTWEAAE